MGFIFALPISVGNVGLITDNNFLIQGTITETWYTNQADTWSSQI